MQFDVQRRARPVIKWAGGKSGLLEQIFPLLPPHFKGYVEPFLGGAAAFLSLSQSAHAILGELNPELFNLYIVVRDRCSELIAYLDDFKVRYSKSFYYELREQDSGDAVYLAARTVFLNKTCFNGLYRQNSKGKFNVPFGHRAQCPTLYAQDNLLAVAERFSRAELLNLDFEQVIARAGQGDLVYCDPPYEPLSKSSSFNAYTQFGFSQAEQVRLKEACEAAVGRGATVALSNSSARFILELYSEWPVHRIKARRAINSNASRRGMIDEVLVVMMPT